MKIVTPERGDIVTASLDPVHGHEQKGRRPLLVISHTDFNVKTGLAVVCPITSKIRGSPFEINILGKQTIGVILTNQIRTIDFHVRRAIICDSVNSFCLEEVIAKIKLIID
ncbi:MAG TPA: type II toxin-antitoxin system PemK/MazF family toxin [Candidatus Paceibacterota bacterium]